MDNIPALCDHFYPNLGVDAFYRDHCTYISDPKIVMADHQGGLYAASHKSSFISKF